MLPTKKKKEILSWSKNTHRYAYNQEKTFCSVVYLPINFNNNIKFTF